MHYFGHLSENEQLSFAKATQLPAFLENEKQLLDQEKKQLHHNHMLRDKQFTQLYEVKCLYWLLFYLMLTISLRLFTYHKKMLFILVPIQSCCSLLRKHVYCYKGFLRSDSCVVNGELSLILFFLLFLHGFEDKN